MGRQGRPTDALASAARSELWVANALGTVALERLQGDTVPLAQLACVLQAAEALVVAVAPVVSNRALVDHVIGVAQALHSR